MPPCIEVVKQGEVSLVPLSAPVRRLPLVLVVDCMGAGGARLHAAHLRGCGDCSPPLALTILSFILCEINIFLL